MNRKTRKLITRHLPKILLVGLVAVSVGMLIACGHGAAAAMAGMLGMAVTANQIVKRREGCRGSAPVEEATTLYEGTLSFFNSSGYLVGIVASGANPFAGIIIKNADNSTGADGAISGEFWTEGDFHLTGTGFTQATVGLDIFATDNYTVTTSNSSASYVGRCVGYVSSTEIVVSLKKTGPVDVLAAAATGTTAATFTVDTDLGKPRAALGSQTGGTGDFTAIIKPPTTLTADHTFTLIGDADATLVNVATAQNLTSKTLTSPVIATQATGAGSTFVPFIPIGPHTTAVAAAAAIPITNYYSTLDSNAGATTQTLANGAIIGQLKKIQMIVDGGDDVVTPANLAGGTIITFADVGDFAILMWSGTEWVAIELGNDADGVTAPVLS